jgi:DNA-binding SARP family transcriptional activator
VQISLLGPMTIRDGAGAPVELAGTRLRLLVAWTPGRPVSSGALIDAVWDDAPPPGALNAL